MTAQPGIFALGTRNHHQLEFTRRPGAAPGAIREAQRGLREPAVAGGGANIVIGFGPDLWNALAGTGEMPDDFTPFAEIHGLDAKHAPATQHDVWVWIHGTGEDVNLDLARAVTAVLAPVAELALEQPSFVYKDSRDLTGFVDGTANPPVAESTEVACVPPGQPGEGGSFVIAQRWVHDPLAFNELAVPDQERVFGRSKADSIELDPTTKPVNAHIARAEIEDDEGEELPIFRRSAPFGTVREQGLYFIGFSADLARLQTMLARMFGTSGDGIRDRLLDFSAPSHGSFFFAPSLEALNAALNAEPDGAGADDGHGAD